MDIYLPVLPALTGDLGATAADAQLTVNACLLGLAAGQTLAESLSGRYGRPRPLLGVVACVACLSLPQQSQRRGPGRGPACTGPGLGGVAQGGGRDLYSGGRLLRYYGRLTVLGGLAASVWPVLGGRLASSIDWRGISLSLAVHGALDWVFPLDPGVDDDDDAVNRLEREMNARLGLPLRRRRR